MNGEKKTYLDENGNPIKVYLDENGNPIQKQGNVQPQKPTGNPFQGMTNVIKPAFTQPGLLAEEGARNIMRGDIPLGVAQSGRAGLQAGMELTGIPTFLRALGSLGSIGKFAQEGLEGVMNLPIRAFQRASGLIDKSLEGMGVPESIRNLGMSPEASREMGALTTEAGTLALLPQFKEAGVRTAGTISGGLKKTGQFFEKKAITPRFQEEKGLEVIDRQVKTALEGNYAPTRRGYQKLKNDLEQTNKVSKQITASSAKRGTVIDFNETNQYLDNLIKESDRASANYEEIKSAIDDAKVRLNRIRDKYPDGKVPIDIANELKASFQNMAFGKYDQAVKPSQVQIEIYKNVGHKLLEQIINEEPQMKAVGFKQRNLIELKPILGRKLDQIEKSPIVSWQDVRQAGLATAAGYATGNPLLGIGTFLSEEALTNPRSLHRMAQISQKAGEAFAIPDKLRTTLPPNFRDESSGGYFESPTTPTSPRPIPPTNPEPRSPKPTNPVANVVTGNTYAAQAQKLGITYRGIDEPLSRATKQTIHRFADENGDFTVKRGESLKDALAKHREKFAEPETPQTKPEMGTKRGNGGRKPKYADADPNIYPALAQLGAKSISPDWTIDAKTGKVRIAGEYENIPEYFLDLSEKPTAQEIRQGGGRVKYGGLDVIATEHGFRDADHLREQLLNDLDRYERDKKMMQEEVKDIPIQIYYNRRQAEHNIHLLKNKNDYEIRPTPDGKMWGIYPSAKLINEQAKIPTNKKIRPTMGTEGLPMFNKQKPQEPTIF